MMPLVSLLILMTPFFTSEAYFIEPDGQLKESLIELLRLDDLYEPGDGLDQAVEKTQKKWLGVVQGKGGKERVDLMDPPEWKALEGSVEKAVDRMGLSLGREPSLKNYDYAFLYGAFFKGMRYRLRRILEAWDSGIRFKELVVLTGDRKIRLGEGSPDNTEGLVATKPLETEEDLAELLLANTELPAGIKVTFIKCRHGRAGRPSTKDTLKTWLETAPLPGTILAPTHPLIFVYQDLAAKNVLPETFLIDTTAKPFNRRGLGSSKGGYVSLVFDTIAKSLYEIHSKPTVNKIKG